MADSKSKRLTISRAQLDKAGSASGVTPQQTDLLWQELSRQPVARQFGAAQVAWYLGAGVVLVALGWFLDQVTSTYGNVALTALSLLYTGLFLFAGRRLSHQDGLRVPAGLLYTLAVCMTPVTVGALEMIFAHGHNRELGVLIMAVATMGVGAITAAQTRISFVSFPAFVAGLFAITTANDLFLSRSWETSSYVSIAYGTGVILYSFFTDRRTNEDYAFWGYLVGALSVFSGLIWADFHYAQFAFFGLLFLVISILLSRRIFAIVGATCVLIWLGRLTYTVFSGSALFPLVLTIIGGAVIYLGVLYSRNAAKVDAAVLRVVPEGVRKWLPDNR